MTAFNDFSEITFVDGTSPPINAANLNAIEGVVNLADKELARSESFRFKEYLEYFRKRNTQDIDKLQSDYSSYDNYDPSGTLSNESSYSGEALLCDQGLKALIPVATSDYFDFSIDLSSALDLTEFLDGSNSTTDDFIILFIKISDIDAFSGGYLYFNIGDTSISNTYEYDVDVDAWALDTGWNVVWIKKSDFYVWAGTPNWNNIDFWQIQLDYNAGYQNEYVIFQLFQMVRHDPDDSDYLNPFQKYFGSVSGWENKFAQSYPVWTIVDDCGGQTQKLGIMKLNPDNFESPFTPGNYRNGMLIYENVNCFVSKFEWICKKEDELPSMTFYIDSTHYAEAYITSSILYLSVANGAAAVDTTYSLDNTVGLNDKIIIFFEKHDDTLRAIVYKNGEKLGICEYETTFASPGDIYLGVQNSDSFGILTDFAISNSINQLHLAEEASIVINKLSNEVVANSTTKQNDNHLFCYLKPNQCYRIELFLEVASNSNDRDIKMAWAISGGEQITKRHVIGPEVASLSSYATEVKISNFDLTADAVYGITSITSRTANIQENFIVKSNENGALLNLQWAQYSSGAQAVTIRAHSYMVVTPVNLQ